MSQIMKAYLGLFLLLLLAFISVGFLGAYMQVLSAQDMHARFVEELEASNFYVQTIKDSFDEADEAGYELKITIYNENGGEQYTNKASLPDKLENVGMGKVELYFPFDVPFFGIHQRQVFTAYAR